MVEVSTTNALIALVGTIFGGGGLKAIEYFLSKKQRADETASKLRDEMREDLKNYREELRSTEREVDKWRDRYYKLIQDCYESGVTLSPTEVRKELNKLDDSPDL